MVVHEAGHVVAAELVGHRWVLARFGGWGVSVGLDPDNPRGWHRITRSIAGPAAQIVCAAPLMFTILLEPIFRDPPVLMPFQYLTPVAPRHARRRSSWRYVSLLRWACSRSRTPEATLEPSNPGTGSRLASPITSRSTQGTGEEDEI